MRHFSWSSPDSHRDRDDIADRGHDHVNAVIVKVPTWRDFETPQQARSALAAVGLTVGHISYGLGSGPPNIVFSSSPKSGSVVPIGTAVDLGVTKYVAGGPTTPVDVPDVRGFGEPAAESMLAEIPFKVVVLREHNTTIKPGDVLRQSPGPGMPAVPNSTVTIWIAKPN